MKDIRTRLLFSGTPPLLLGGLTLAGTIHGSQGIPRTRMRILGNYAVVYLVKGSGEYGDARGVRRSLQPGDLIWIFPELPHYYGPPLGGHWEEIYLVFNGPVFDLWRRQRLLDPDDPVWHLEPVSRWFNRITRATRPNDGLGQAVQLQALFAAMQAGREAPGRQDEDQWLKRARCLLEEEALSLKEVARQAGMNYEAFRKQFARRNGCGPAAYRQSRRIERACALLMQPGSTNKTIAEHLGFCDEFHFAKMFSKRMGLSPRAFRRQALGNHSGT